MESFYSNLTSTPTVKVGHSEPVATSCTMDPDELGTSQVSIIFKGNFQYITLYNSFMGNSTIVCTHFGSTYILSYLKLIYRRKHLLLLYTIPSQRISVYFPLLKCVPLTIVGLYQHIIGLAFACNGHLK